MTRKILCINLFVFVCVIASAQKFSNTIEFDSASMKSPDASLLHLKWLSGTWEGTAFGGRTQELWSFPSDGSMMCVFKLSYNGSVQFYELITLTETAGTLIMHLRHFDHALNGWEEKKKPLVFPLVSIEKNRVLFDGFTYEYISANEINVYVILQDREGKKEEMKFNYKRVI